MSKSTLFSGFSNVNKADWKEKVLKDLKGANFHEKLCWNTAENITLDPLYTKEDTEKLDYLQHYLAGKSEAEAVGMSPRNWRNCQKIKIKEGAEKEANERALLALKNDANEIIFKPENIQLLDFEILMNQIQVEFCAISWEVNSENVLFFLDKYVAFCESKSFDSQKVNGFLRTNSLENSSEIIKKTASFPLFRSLTLSAENTKNSTDELAELAVKTVQLLEVEENPEMVLNNLIFSSLAKINYFEEIAKLRGLRFLITEIAQKYVPNYKAESVYILSQSSVKIDENDPYQNMLSNTTQAMSAIIGGCQSLHVIPHNQGVEDISAFSERIARNVSNLLREESYFGTVIDPASGSYYLESLTDKFMEMAWTKFVSRLKK